MAARRAAWLRVSLASSGPQVSAGAPALTTARDVIDRARALAALANGIQDDVMKCAARVPDADYAAWKLEYAKDALVVDPMTDPMFGIIANPWSAWTVLDNVEPGLLEWRRRVNAWCGLDVPVPAPTKPPGIDFGVDTSTKLLVGGALILGIIVAWKL